MWLINVEKNKTEKTNKVIALSKLNTGNKLAIKTNLECRSITKNYLLAEQLADICQKHQSQHKWILVIDNEDSSVNQLSHNQEIDTTKILRVNSRKVKVNFDNIKTAVTKGNCSAVVLCDNQLKQDQLNQLSNSANSTNTKVFVFNQPQALH